MAEKKIYIGSVGPYLFDDTDNVNDADGDFSGLTMRALLTDGEFYTTGSITVGDLELLDTNASNELSIKWNEDDSIDRVLNLEVGGANRTLDVDEDIKGSLIINQEDVDDTPVNGVTTAPISSNWAYDHQAMGGAANEHYHLTSAEYVNLISFEKAAILGTL